MDVTDKDADVEFLNEREWQVWITRQIREMKADLAELREEIRQHVNDETHDFGTVKAHIAEIVDWLKSIDK